MTFFNPGDLSFSAELWAQVLGRLQITELVLIEIPLDATAPKGFEVVWDNIRTARNLLQRGGDFAWESCAAAVRRALEEWQKIEPLDIPSRAEKGVYPSKYQRLDRIRQDLAFYVSYPLHVQNGAGHVDQHAWTRDDVVLSLSTLCALLSVRKPHLRPNTQSGSEQPTA